MRHLRFLNGLRVDAIWLVHYMQQAECTCERFELIILFLCMRHSRFSNGLRVDAIWFVHHMQQAKCTLFFFMHATCAFFKWNRCICFFWLVHEVLFTNNQGQNSHLNHTFFPFIIYLYKCDIQHTGTRGFCLQTTASIHI